MLDKLIYKILGCLDNYISWIDNLFKKKNRKKK